MTAADISAALDARKLDVLVHLFPAGRVIGHEFAIGSLAGEAGSSLKIALNGKGTVWSDFATGESGGDLLDLWSQTRCGGDLGVALAEAADWLGINSSKERGRAMPKAKPLRVASVDPPVAHPTLGAPDDRYEYTAAEGHTIGFVCRWNAHEGRQKELRPLTFRDGRWKWQGFDRPYPLYRLADLAARPDAPVLIVEGEKTADTAVQIFDEHCVTTWPHGTKGAAHVDLGALAGRNCWLWPDNDDPGRQAMHTLADRLKGAGASRVAIVAPLVDQLPDAWDLADPLPDGWTFDDLGGLLQAAAVSYTAPMPRLHVAWFDNVQAVTETSYLIKGIINEGEISNIIGEPSCGKTHFATDAGYHIAAGISWHGHRVRHAGVIYVAAEGGGGIFNRLNAIRQRHSQTQGVPLGIITAAVDLWRPDGDTGQLIERIMAAGETIRQPIKLIVLDTLHRVMAGGDENSPADMGAVINNVARIRDETGCHVMLIHHLGKDATRGGRGHSSLRGAVDTEIVIKRDSATGITSARIDKQRNGPGGAEISFKLEVVNLGIDQDGDAITGCIVVDAEGKRMTSTDTIKLSAPCAIALTALRQAIAEAGEIPPASVHIPTNVKAVPVELWRKYAYQRAISNEGPDARRKAFKRASEQLQARGLVACWGDSVWPTA